MNVHNAERLKELQDLPLNRKILITQSKIIEWYVKHQGKCVVSFSGGKDSTLLLYLVRQIYPDVKGVFYDTGLEYPENRELALSQKNMLVIKPKLHFREILTKYGYPVISKMVSQVIASARRGVPCSLKIFNGGYARKDGRISVFDFRKYKPLLDLPIKFSDVCCKYSKKLPSLDLAKSEGYSFFLGTTTEESSLRRLQWIKTGCNAFDRKPPASKPLSFWREQDILLYLKKYNIPISKIYGEIISVGGKFYCSRASRTGCIYCAFGAHLEKRSRFQILKERHPKLYDYCMGGGQWVKNDAATDYWSPKEIWVPSKSGLGLAKVFDMVNQIYGSNFIQY